MALDASAPWHGASFDRFLNERLPELLAARLPLAGYRVEPTGRYEVRITVALAFGAREITAVYAGVPCPDEEGVFEIEGVQRVVIPIATEADLAVAEIHCVGEQLHDVIAARLGEAPADLPWDEALLRTWLPLDTWARDFVSQVGQSPREGNWLERRAHLRRVRVQNVGAGITPGHFGRVCPIETPEGPNIGRLVAVAVGAEIREGRLVITDSSPEAGLGLTASMIPFLEHSDPNRLLMGANMMRQWLVPPDPEPALVQTGNEPDALDFWCGRNLLTAFISWGVDTFEDAIVISESCAKRLGYPHPIEPGDKLSNRHGSKGVVSRILPDEAMPRLQDGTPVELLFHFMGLNTRMNYGQVREALMGRIARAEGRTSIVPPFGAPSADELRRRLAEAKLPEDGMERLIVGRAHGGHPSSAPTAGAEVTLPLPSMVGWVYWGRLHHLAREKVAVFVEGPRAQRQGEAEYVALRDAGAFENIREQFNTRAAEREDAATLAARVAAGSIEQAGPPAPQFAALARRLAVGGIRPTMAGEELVQRGGSSPPVGPSMGARRQPGSAGVSPASGAPSDAGETPALPAGLAADFRRAVLAVAFGEPEGERLTLARPVAHPWARGRELREVGAAPDMSEYRALVEANARLARLETSQAPESLISKAVADLEARVRALFDALVTPAHLRPSAGVLFSGRAVIAPGGGLRPDQVGLAEEIAWGLFGPLVARELGDAAAARARDERAGEALDALMARTWVLIYRPGFFVNGLNAAPAPFLAFHPVRIPERVIRLHPLACNLMDSDFDGDELTVLLPITAAAQREAGERLSIAGRLARDPALLAHLCPIQEAVWGLASLCLTAAGREEIAALLGRDVPSPGGLLDKRALVAGLQELLQRAGVERTLVVVEELMRRGFEICRDSGASVSPFMGASIDRPAQPESDDPEEWSGYREEIGERLLSRTDYENSDIGPQLLAMKSGARGNLKQLIWHVGAHSVADFAGPAAIIRHGNCEGLTPEEFYTHTVGTWKGLLGLYNDWEGIFESLRRISEARGFHVLARAMRSKHPGIVFAHAAAMGEVDPLTDADSRLFVGLPID